MISNVCIVVNDVVWFFSLNVVQRAFVAAAAQKAYCVGVAILLLSNKSYLG